MGSSTYQGIIKPEKLQQIIAEKNAKYRFNRNKRSDTKNLTNCSACGTSLLRGAEPLEENGVVMVRGKRKLVRKGTGLCLGCKGRFKNEEQDERV